MSKEYVSACKLINILSVILLCMCNSDKFLAGSTYAEYLVIIGVVVYGLSMRWIGTKLDHLVRIR